MKINFVIGVCFLVFCTSCYYDDLDIDVCLDSDLEVAASAENSSSCDTMDGSITATSSGGIGSYLFSIDGGVSMQPSGVFDGLAGGSYLIIAFDENLCSDSTTVEVGIADTDFRAEVVSINPVTDCEGENGEVQLSATGGSGEFSYTLDSQSNEDGLFDNLPAGIYDASVTDNSCTVTLQVEVPLEVGISYAVDIAPLITAKCDFDGCHGSNSSRPNFTVYDNVKEFSAGIKSRTQSGSMPRAPQPGGSLTDAQVELIACWVDAGAPNN